MSATEMTFRVGMAEEAEYRRVHVGSAGPHSSTTCYRCWEGTCPVPVLLATLDAAREQAATEERQAVLDSRRELLAKVEALRDDDRAAIGEPTDDGGWQYVQWLRETAVLRLIEESQP